MPVSSLARSYKSVGEKLKSDLSNWYEWSDQMKEYLVFNRADKYISGDVDSDNPTEIEKSAVVDQNVSTTYGMIKQWLGHEIIDKYLRDSDGHEERSAVKACKKT
jgi:hypothetical protein